MRILKKIIAATKTIGKALVAIAEVVLAVLAVVSVFNGDKTATVTAQSGKQKTEP